MAEDPSKDSDAIEWLVLEVYKKKDAMSELLLEYAESIHIHGVPYVWFVEWLIETTPNLKRVRVVSAYAHMLEPEHEAGKLLTDRNIQIGVGYVRSKRGGKGGLGASSYRDKHYFMLYLDEERKRLLEEVQKYAPEDWRIASRYLCLGGEKHITLQDLACELGVSTGHIQEAVGTILYQLDSPFDAPLAAVRRARVLQEKISRGREEERQAAARKAKLWAMGLSESDLPEGMSFQLVDLYALILKAWRFDRLSEESVRHSERFVLVRRYGLEDKKFRTLEEVGQELGVTRERVRQVESSALKRIRGNPKLSTPSQS